MNPNDLAYHADHRWAQQGRCVYCTTCEVRLYQGKLPPAGGQKEFATGLDKALESARQEFLTKVAKEWDERSPEQNEAWLKGLMSYEPGDTIMDRMKRGNPYKGTDLAKWFNMGWTNAEGKYFEKQESRTHADDR